MLQIIKALLNNSFSREWCATEKLSSVYESMHIKQEKTATTELSHTSDANTSN